MTEIQSRVNTSSLTFGGKKINKSLHKMSFLRHLHIYNSHIQWLLNTFMELCNQHDHSFQNIFRTFFIIPQRNLVLITDVSTSPSYTPWKPLIDFLSPGVWLFQVPCVNGSGWFAAVCDMLLSFSIMLSRFICVLLCTIPLKKCLNFLFPWCLCLYLCLAPFVEIFLSPLKLSWYRSEWWDRR